MTSSGRLSVEAAAAAAIVTITSVTGTRDVAVSSQNRSNKKHLKNVGPIHDCEPPHAHSPGVATGTVARRMFIDVHDDNA